MGDPMGQERAAKLIRQQLGRVNKLPCRVDEMTPREFEIFKLLASHTGFLQFLEGELSGNRMIVMDNNSTS